MNENQIIVSRGKLQFRERANANDLPAAAGIRMKIRRGALQEMPIPLSHRERQFPLTAVFYARAAVVPLRAREISRCRVRCVLGMASAGYRRIVINFLNGMHIHACVSYAKQGGSSGKYLRAAAADIFRENARTRICNSEIFIGTDLLKRFTDIRLRTTRVYSHSDPQPLAEIYHQ